jgi:fructokinase
VKLSDEDAAWLYPDLSGTEVVDHILNAGPSVVAITAGEAGSVLASRTARVTVAAVATALVDTIGAGDSYMAALIHMVLHAPLAARFDSLEKMPATTQMPHSEAQLRQIGEFASRVAAFTVGRRGADSPYLSELL